MWECRSKRARSRGLRFDLLNSPEQVVEEPSPGTYWWALRNYIKTGQVVKTWQNPEEECHVEKPC